MNPHTNKPYTEEELKQCPFHNKRIQDSPFKEKITMQSYNEIPDNQSTIDKKCPIMGQNNVEVDEAEQPQGGCPMMQVSASKRNPTLYVPESVYPEPYVSPFHEFLGPSLMFNFGRQNTKTEKWDKYPIFLKNTIFYHTENFKKYRGLEIGYKFFVTDEMREKANEEYHKGNYDTAINMLEKGIACMRWLDCQPDEIPRFNMPNQGELSDMINQRREENQDFDELLKEEKNLDFTKNNTKNNEEGKEVDNFFEDKMNRLMFTTFHDDNVKLCDREGLKTAGDHDMYDNILFSLYNNMVAYYLKGNYLNEAKQALTELEKINSTNSMVLFRKAQLAQAYAGSTIEELEEGLSAIRKAMESKKSENLFQQNPTFLKSFNLSNHEEVYSQLEMKLVATIKIKKDERQDHLRKILRRAREIKEAELDIIKRGLTPQESPESNYLMFYKAENVEIMLLDNMLDKYRRVAEFYSSGEEKKQVEAGKIGYQYVNGLRNQFLQLWNIDFSNLSEIDNEIVNNLILMEYCR